MALRPSTTEAPLTASPRLAGRRALQCPPCRTSSRECATAPSTTCVVGHDGICVQFLIPYLFMFPSWVSRACTMASFNSFSQRVVNTNVEFLSSHFFHMQWFERRKHEIDLLVFAIYSFRIVSVLMFYKMKELCRIPPDA